MASRVIRRDDVRAAFRGITPLLELIVAEARKGSSFSVVAASNPEVLRESHIHRLAGSKRWMLVADGIVAREAEMPEGCAVISTEQDHNGGRYVFRFPGGVFTVKKQPHQEDEGAYLQERLDEILEQAPLAEGINPDADLKVFLSVPAKSPARLLVTHPSLDKQMVILLDEIGDEVPITIASGSPKVRPRVRSSRRELEVAASIDDAPK